MLDHLTTTEAIYVAGRTVIVALCVIVALVSLLRLAAMGRAHAPRPRMWLPVGAAAMLLTGAGLSACEAWQSIMVHPDEPILTSSWAWLPYDALVPLVGMLLLQALAERDAALERVARQAVTDALTGVRNRRGFMAEADAALARCARAGQDVAVVMLDLDRFKSINDQHGHAVGDDVLRATAAMVQAMLRAGDLSGRLGGEEFALLLPDTSLDGAVTIAERIRVALPNAVPHPGDGRVTASFGVSVVQPRLLDGPPLRQQALDAALAAADGALYRAKKRGRDRVEIADGEAAR